MSESISQTAGQPQAVDARTSITGLRAVATFEAVKGTGVIVLAIILVAVHSHAEDFTENLLYHLHIDPDRRAGQALMNAAFRLTDARVWTIIAAAFSYATVRFVEAWGLWHRRVWAEWFALLSGAMYLPWEILKLIERTSWEHIAILVLNLTIIIYMLFIRVRGCTSGDCAPVLTDSPIPRLVDRRVN